VRGADKVKHVDLNSQRKVVDAFLTALRAGDFEGLLAALVNGSIGLVFAPLGRLSRAFSFNIVGEKIVEAELIADPERLRRLDLSALDEAE
jgi:RNA polymerase sigma-70 factor (ECF subfamily)